MHPKKYRDITFGIETLVSQLLRLSHYNLHSSLHINSRGWVEHLARTIRLVYYVYDSGLWRFHSNSNDYVGAAKWSSYSWIVFHVSSC